MRGYRRPSDHCCLLIPSSLCSCGVRPRAPSDRLGLVAMGFRFPDETFDVEPTGVLVEVGEVVVTPLYPLRTPFVEVPWARGHGGMQIRRTATKKLSRVSIMGRCLLCSGLCDCDRVARTLLISD